jgi:hypothetical protein
MLVVEGVELRVPQEHQEVVEMVVVEQGGIKIQATQFQDALLLAVAAEVQVDMVQEVMPTQEVLEHLVVLVS